MVQTAIAEEMVRLKMWQVGSSSRSVAAPVFEIENVGGTDKLSLSVLIVWNS